ncbi:MAG TPA: hypothetical protein VFI78_01970 [Salinimicrobium sp.]|nr:hypothetical protein [Salinimicrobium sp.]
MKAALLLPLRLFLAKFAIIPFTSHLFLFFGIRNRPLREASELASAQTKVHA